MPVPTARCRGELSFMLIVLLALLPVVWPQAMVIDETGSGTTTTTEATPSGPPAHFYDITERTCQTLPAAYGYVQIPLDLCYFMNGVCHTNLIFHTAGYFTDIPYTTGNEDASCASIITPGFQKPSALIGTIIRPSSVDVGICYRVSYASDTGAQKDADFAKALADGLVASIDDITYVVVVTVDDRTGTGNYYQVVLVAGDYIRLEFSYVVHRSSSTPISTFLGYCSRGAEDSTQGIFPSNTDVTFPGSVFNPSVDARTALERAVISTAIDKFLCRLWMIGKSAIQRYEMCPCRWAQSLADSRFITTSVELVGVEIIACSSSTIPTGTALCCYSLTSVPSYLRYDTGFVYATTGDIEARDYCANGGLGNEFNALRPAVTCTRYRPPRTTSCGGDPFIITSDGFSYQCSPTGYFRMYISGTAIVDARMVTRGSGASAIEAVAARNGTGTVLFELNAQGTVDISVILSGQTQVITDANFVDGVARPGGVSITVQPAVDATPIGYIAKFDGSNFQVLVRAWSNSATSFLEVLVLLDQELLGTENGGLIGPYDGFMGNDLTNPAGESISLESSSRQILEQICLAWEVPTTHIFPTTTTFVPHTPMVCDEIPADPAAVAVCNGDPICECTGTALGPDAGTLTLNALEDVNATIEVFNNNAPFVTRAGDSADRTVIFAQVGVATVITYVGEDADGHTTTLTVSGQPTTGFSFTAGVLSWTPQDRTVISGLSIVATDELGTVGVPLDITIILCDTSGHGTCRFDTLLPTYSPTDRFQLVTTNCVNGYIGDFCESDFEGCAPGIHQCLNEASCVDASPEEELMTNNTYTCTACGVGADLVSDQCVDIDECASGACEQLCTNTFGSFTCACNAGYIAANDTHCNDIDECATSTDNCQQICINNEGGFNCSCHPGFTFMNSMCEIDANTDMVCESASCDTTTTICSVDETDNSTAVCNCLPGFEMGTNPNSCDAINECTSATSPHVCRMPSTCLDTNPGYNCTCPPGYTPEADMRGCQPCPEGLWGDDCVGFCLCLDPAACDPANGCPACRPGFTGGSCETDINECDTPGSCPQNSTCMNTEGTFLCPCDTNYVFNTTSQLCDPMNACLDQPCSMFGACVQLGITYRCDCFPGYTEDDCSMEIDECIASGSMCQNGASCVDAINGFLCDCASGFMGILCEAPIPTTTTAPPPVLTEFTGTLTTGCEIPADTTTAGYMAFISGLQDAITTAVKDQLAVDASTVISNVNQGNGQVTFVVSVPSEANLTSAEIVNAVATGLINTVGLRCPDDTPVVINPGAISVGGVGAVPEARANTLPLILGVLLGIAFLVLLTVLIAYCSKRVFNAGHVLVGRRTFIAGGQPPTSRYWGSSGASMRWLPHGIINPTGLAGIQPRARPVDHPWAVDQYEPEADETPWNAWRGADNAYYGRAVLRPTPVSNLPALEALPSAAAPTPRRGLMFRNLPNAGGLRRTGPLMPSMPRLPAMRLPRMPNLPSMPSLPSIPFFRRQAPVAPPAPEQIYMNPMAMARPAVPFAMGPQMIPMGAMGMRPSAAPPASNFTWQANSPF